jgi:hypothetical protein
MKRLVLECESARGKKDMTEVQGGLIAGDIIQRELIDKLESYSGNTQVTEEESDQFH